MKNWNTVLWLLLFFPIGLYLMFTQTDWSKRTKYLLSAVCGVVVIFLIASGFILESLLLSGVLVLTTGLISTVTAFIRKKEFRTSIAVLFAGLLLFGFSYQQIEVRTQKEIAYAEQLRVEEEIRIEKEIQQKLLADSVVAVEKAEQITDRTTYQDALTLVSQLKKKDNNLENRLKVIDQQLIAQEETKAAVALVEKAEQEKTRGRYEEALQAIDALKTEQADLIKRLVEVEKVVAADEQKVTEATDSLAQAENSKLRTDYEKASLLVTSLPRQDAGLTKRLETLDSNIQVEEKRIAETERVAEEKRIAEEKARAVEEARLVAEQQAEEEAAIATAQTQEGAPTVAANDYGDDTYIDENVEGAIKGSVNGIYHTPGSTYYDRTTNVVQWFNTIEEAEAAGYRAPKR